MHIDADIHKTLHVGKDAERHIDKPDSSATETLVKNYRQMRQRSKESTEGQSCMAFVDSVMLGLSVTPVICLFACFFIYKQETRRDAFKNSMDIS